MRRRFSWSYFASPTGCLAIGLSAALLYGQNSPPVTFHVYANLLQVPVSVLSPSLKPLPGISGSRFAISLDAGPKFRPTHVRLEGDDPIALSILLDVSESDTDLVPGIDELIAGLSPDFLRRSDHVSIYALDCSLTRSLYDVPADSAQLKDGVDAALRSWNSRLRRKQAQCKKEVHLWDALAFITEKMSSLPGRRVILAVTDGRDRGSFNTWNELRVFAAASGVAIFGMTRHEPRHNDSPGFRWRGIMADAGPISEDVFQFVCAETGGLVLTTKIRKVSRELERFTTMLRERYILEFPRTDSAASGPHSLEVTIANSNALIRSAGISVPIADPHILADPTTVPSDPSHAPQYGKRRVLTPE
jgi:hypothetical protein